MEDTTAIRGAENSLSVGDIMGFSIQNVVILYWLKHHGMIKAGDAVLELGSQQLNNDIIENLESLDGLAKLFGVASFKRTFDWKVHEQKYLESGMQHLPEDAPFARQLYEHLGLRYVCVDIDDHPDSLKLDLNYDPVPEEHKGKYALVTNLGTTEHVANQLNAFKVIHDLTAKNGVMVHSLPFQGFATHGLVNYTMKFFWLLNRSNRYRIIDADISSWEKTYLPEEIVHYAKNNSLIFANKQHVDKVGFQDTGMTMILQKCHNEPFAPFLDVPAGAQTTDPVLKKRYSTAFKKDPWGDFLLQGRVFLKKLLNR